MFFKTIMLALLSINLSCKNGQVGSDNFDVVINKIKLVDTTKNENPYLNIAQIPAPSGFERIQGAENSFPSWLRSIKLKKDKRVYLFDGRLKKNQAAQFAVLNIPVGHKDLQQCADAVMRLRASWLFEQKKFDSIIFYDNELHPYKFTPAFNSLNFESYLQRVFAMCGTASLAKQLTKIEYKTIAPGDVLIRGGFPGHAVIVVDMVVNSAGKKKYLLAQSYMPAQDIHILINPGSESMSPWYDLNEAETIITPEFSFRSNEWRRW